MESSVTHFEIYGEEIKPAVLGGDSHPIAACMIAPEPVRKAQEAIMSAVK